MTSLLILLLKYKSEKEYFFKLSESIRLDKPLNCYLAIILSLVHGKNHLRRHPVRRPDKTVGRTRDTGRAEVGQLNVTRICYQNIASFYVPKIINLEMVLKVERTYMLFCRKTQIKDGLMLVWELAKIFKKAYFSSKNGAKVQKNKPNRKEHLLNSIRHGFLIYN